MDYESYSPRDSAKPSSLGIAFALRQGIQSFAKLMVVLNNIIGIIITFN